MKHLRIINASNRINARALAYSCVLAMCLFATLAAAVLGRNLVNDLDSSYLQPFVSWLPQSTAASLAIMAAFGIVIGIACYFFLTRFQRISSTLMAIRPSKFMGLKLNRRDVIFCGLAILVLWLPILIIMYPGGMPVDTVNQIYQFESAPPTFYPTLRNVIHADFIDHHPVFDTLIYGVFWKIGYLLGNQKATVFALVILQSVILAAELGFLTCYLEKLRVPWLLQLASLLFFGLFPIIPHYAATVLKDVTYLTFFIPWMIIWIEIARTRGGALANNRLLIAFMLLGGACVLSKKLGAFLLVPCLILLVLFVKQGRMRALLSSVATVLLFVVMLPALATPLLNIAPGGQQESLGPAIQHLTALMKENGNAVTPEEREDLERVFDVDVALSRYEPYRSDGAKSTFKPETTEQDIKRMLQLWMQEGLEHPLTYAKSTAQTCGMLFIPFMKMTYYYNEDYSLQAYIYGSYWPQFRDFDLDQPDALKELNDYLLYDSIESKISDLPVISLLFTQGFYGGWVPLITFILILYARKASRKVFDDASKRPLFVLAIAPMLISVALFVISPVASPRYVLHLMFTAPLLLSWAWYALDWRLGQR